MRADLGPSLEVARSQRGRLIGLPGAIALQPRTGVGRHLALAATPI
jgi:hypothetical protein